MMFAYCRGKEGATMTTLQALRGRGFDRTEHVPFTKEYRVRCSQCEATGINGVACHETGCPNQHYECKGCSATLNHQGYCMDCI